MAPAHRLLLLLRAAKAASRSLAHHVTEQPQRIILVLRRPAVVIEAFGAASDATSILLGEAARVVILWHLRVRLRTHVRRVK